jgi:hypothetical protein
METIKKMKIDYIAPNCGVISVEQNAIMAGSNSDWQVHGGEVPGQGAKQGGFWGDDNETNDETNDNNK